MVSQILKAAGTQYAVASGRYDPTVNKVVGLVDEACSRVRMLVSTTPSAFCLLRYLVGCE